MSDVVAYSAISSPLIPPQASPAPQPAPVPMRAPRGDALRCPACSMRSICMPQGLSAEAVYKMMQRVRMALFECINQTLKRGELA